MNELINSLKGTILYTNMRSYNPTVHSLISAKLDNNVFVDSGDSYAGIFDEAVALEGYVSSMISRMVKVDRVNDIVSMRVNMLMTVCLIKRPESVLEDINRVVRPFNTFVRYEKYDGPCGGLCVSGFEGMKLKCVEFSCSVTNLTRFLFLTRHALHSGPFGNEEGEQEKRGQENCQRLRRHHIHSTRRGDLPRGNIEEASPNGGVHGLLRPQEYRSGEWRQC